MSDAPAPRRLAGLAGLVLTCLLATGCSVGPSGQPGAAGSTSVGTASSASADLLRNVIVSDGPGCSAAVAVQGKVVWAGARGLADVAAGRPITVATEFDLASVSKQFTATAVLLLAQQGAVHLNDPLAMHVKGMPAWAQKVTLDQLLHHTAGVPDYTPRLVKAGSSTSEPASQDDALATIAAIPSLDAPGTAFRYSNSHYVLLAEVVRAASGVDLPAFLKARVFDPLHLAMRMEPAATSPTIATPYAKNGTSWRATPSRWTQIGDGSVHTTPSELAQWGDQYRTGKVGGKGWLDAITAGAVPTGAPNRSRYGAGIEIAPDGALSHLGGWSGYVTAFGASADRSTVIALSCNTSDLPFDTLTSGLLRIWVNDQGDG